MNATIEQTVCSTPGCIEGYLERTENGYQVMVRCPECRQRRRVEALKRRVDSITEVLGENWRILLAEPERAKSDHPAALNAKAAWKEIQFNRLGFPVGGVIFKGDTGSGKTSAIALLLSLVIRKWYEIDIAVFNHSDDFIRRYTYDDETKKSVSNAHVVVVDNIAPMKFKDRSNENWVRQAMHKIIDDAYAKRSLVILAKSCADDEIADWLLEDAIRRLNTFGPKSGVPFRTDSGCPWNEEQ